MPLLCIVWHIHRPISMQAWGLTGCLGCPVASRACASGAKITDVAKGDTRPEQRYPCSGLLRHGPILRPVSQRIDRVLREVGAIAVLPGAREPCFEARALFTRDQVELLWQGPVEQRALVDIAAM